MSVRLGRGRRVLRPAQAAALALFLVTTSAFADPTKDECVDANTKAQSLRRENKLRDARTQLLLCANESCPAIVREDCAERLDELDRIMPTIVFDAKNREGRDLSAVTVMLDGAPWIQKLDGAAISVDPGEHDFTFAVNGEPPITQHLIVHEGEKSRRETITLGPAAVPTPVVVPAPAAKLSVLAGASDSLTVDGAAVGVGRWEGTLPPGAHDVKVSHPGKKPYHATVELQSAALRTLEVTLESESTGVPTWVWVASGVVFAGGAAVGGYFLLRGKEEPGARPVGGLGSVSLSFGRLGRF